MDESATDSFGADGLLVRFLARHAETGAYCLVEATFAPGMGPPPNRHPGEDEGCYVVEGRFAFSVDGEERIVEAGEWVKVPDGAVHAFRNAGDGPGRLIVLNAPGAMHDVFFSRVGDALPPDTRELPGGLAPPDPGRLRAAAKASGMELVENG
ncbi:MAG: cupin domain-containing protein [Paracoccaceae bacterium]